MRPCVPKLSSRNQPLLEYQWPTYEACEIHSMGMEFLTYPWMELYFGEEAERFRRIHMTGTIIFLPYVVSSTSSSTSCMQIPAADLKLGKRSGESWRKNIFHGRTTAIWNTRPAAAFGRFRAISTIRRLLHRLCTRTDVRTADLEEGAENRDKALSDYMAICAPGGSQSFLQLVKTGDLRNPFEPGVISGLVAEIDGLVKQDALYSCGRVL